MVRMDVLNDALKSIVNAERFQHNLHKQKDKEENKFSLDHPLKLLSSS